MKTKVLEKHGMVEYFCNLRVVKSILSKTKTQRKRLYLLNFLGMVKYLLRTVTTEAKGNKTKQRLGKKYL